MKLVEREICEAKRQTFAAAAKKHLKRSYKGETDTKLYNLPDEEFFRLDGHLLHADGIRTWPVEGLKNGNESDRKALAAAHASLTKALGEKLGAKLGEDGPKPYPVSFTPCW